MKKILIIIGVIALGAAIYGYLEYNRKNANLADEKEDVSIKAADLSKAFKDNEAEANTKYLDKIVSVSGVVSEVSKDGSATKLTFDTGDPMAGVICEMDSSFAAKALSLQKGSSVVVKGVCSGALGDVICNRCVIQE